MSLLTWGKQFENAITGKRDSKLCNLLDCEGLALNSIFKYKRRGGTDHTTFNEIKIVPYREALDPYWFDLMGVLPSTKKMTGGQFVNGFMESMVSYIEKVWNPNKFHIILHSSGFDSRILSSILRRVCENLGEASFGNFLFACWGVEGKHLDLMMKAAGWGADNCISIPRYTEEYYEYNLDFEKAPLHLNGSSTYPINDLYWIIDELKSMNKIPQDMDKIELWGAGYFNEVFEYILGNKRNGIKRFLNLYYYSFGSSMISALPCTFMPPMLNPETITYLVKSKRAYKRELRGQILKNINPELFKIARITTPRRMPLPEKYAHQTKRDFDGSWYGKNIVPATEAIPVIRHNNWWLRWSAAATIERYRKGLD